MIQSEIQYSGTNIGDNLSSFKKNFPTTIPEDTDETIFQQKTNITRKDTLRHLLKHFNEDLAAIVEDTFLEEDSTRGLITNYIHDAFKTLLQEDINLYNTPK